MATPGSCASTACNRLLFCIIYLPIRFPVVAGCTFAVQFQDNEAPSALGIVSFGTIEPCLVGRGGSLCRYRFAMQDIPDLLQDAGSWSGFDIRATSARLLNWTTATV